MILTFPHISTSTAAHWVLFRIVTERNLECSWEQDLAAANCGYTTQTLPADLRCEAIQRLAGRGWEFESDSVYLFFEFWRARRLRLTCGLPTASTNVWASFPERCLTTWAPPRSEKMVLMIETRSSEVRVSLTSRFQDGLIERSVIGRKRWLGWVMSKSGPCTHQVQLSMKYGPPGPSLLRFRLQKWCKLVTCGEKCRTRAGLMRQCPAPTDPVG